MHNWHMRHASGLGLGYNEVCDVIGAEVLQPGLRGALRSSPPPSVQPAHCAPEPEVRTLVHCAHKAALSTHACAPGPELRTHTCALCTQGCIKHSCIAHTGLLAWPSERGGTGQMPCSWNAELGACGGLQLQPRVAGREHGNYATDGCVHRRVGERKRDGRPETVIVRRGRGESERREMGRDGEDGASRSSSGLVPFTPCILWDPGRQAVRTAPHEAVQHPVHESLRPVRVYAILGSYRVLHHEQHVCGGHGMIS